MTATNRNDDRGGHDPYRVAAFTVVFVVLVVAVVTCGCAVLMAGMVLGW